MNIERAKEILELHFESESSVILLCGDWGIGKSYLMREYLKQRMADNEEFKYLFVSAFNVGSLSDFRKTLGVEYLTRFVNSDSASSVARTGFKLLESIPIISNYVKNIDSNLSEIGYQLLSGATIWIDDLERCHDPKVVGLILGEAYSLAEQKGCKILIAANTEEIIKNQNMKASLEKVCTSQFTFKRDRDEIYSIGLSRYSDSSELADILTTMGCCNLRILFRISRAADILFKGCPPINCEISTQVLKTIAIATIAKYGEHHKLQSIEELYSYDVKIHGNTEQGKYLHSLGYYTSDNLDKIVIDFVNNGVIEISGFRSYINENIDQANRSKAKNSYSRLVDSIFRNFGITDAQIMEKMKLYISENKDYIDVYMYDSLIKVLRNVNQQRLISQILKEIPEEFELDAVESELSYKNRIGFEDVISTRIKWVYPEQPKNLFENTVLKIAKTNGWNQDDLVVLSSIKPEQIAEYLLEEAGENGTSVIATMLQFGEFQNNPQYKAIGLNAIAALDVIRSKGNPIATALCDSFNQRSTNIMKLHSTP